MGPVVLLLLQALAAVALPVGLALWLHRRTGARASTFGWGTLAFVGSQALRIPLLVGLTLAAAAWRPSPDAAFWLNLVVLSLTSGLFEETARWVVLRWGAKDARELRDGVMFGVGHGGIEAVLLIGFAVTGALTLLVMGDTIVEQVRASAPEQVPTVQAQLEAVRGMRWWEPLVSIQERVAAIALHVALSLVVLRGVREGRPAAWGAAVALHAGVNAVVMLIMRAAGVVVASLCVPLVVTPVLVGVAWWWRRRPEG